MFKYNKVYSTQEIFQQNVNIGLAFVIPNFADPINQLFALLNVHINLLKDAFFVTSCGYKDYCRKKNNPQNVRKLHVPLSNKEILYIFTLITSFKMSKIRKIIYISTKEKIH